MFDIYADWPKNAKFYTRNHQLYAKHQNLPTLYHFRVEIANLRSHKDVLSQNRRKMYLQIIVTLRQVVCHNIISTGPHIFHMHPPFNECGQYSYRPGYSLFFFYHYHCQVAIAFITAQFLLVTTQIPPYFSCQALNISRCSATFRFG